ncbi:Cation/H(+) antiporter 18, partial [Cucurbita argyrosperma subsp. sororia]
MASNTTAVTKYPCPMKATSNGIFQGDNPLDFALPLVILQICLVLILIRYSWPCFSSEAIKTATSDRRNYYFIGIHAMFGAFVVGVLVRKDGPLVGAFVDEIEDPVSGLFLPLYFV